MCSSSMCTFLLWPVIDPNLPTVCSSLSAAYEIFRHIDKDGTGTVSCSELKATAMADLIVVVPQARKALMAIIGQGGDLTVS